jgi:hypothetical protein
VQGAQTLEREAGLVLAPGQQPGTPVLPGPALPALRHSLANWAGLDSTARRLVILLPLP